MLHIRKKLVMSLLAASLCFSSAPILYVPAHAAEVTEVADKLMEQYPGTIEQWTKSGLATGVEVENFINAVSQKVEESGNITESNINQKFEDALFKVGQEPAHSNAAIAAVDAFDIDINDIKVPVGMQPVVQVIKNEVLSANTPPASGSNPTSGGGIGGVTLVTTPVTPIVPPVADEPVQKVSEFFADVKDHWAEASIQRMFDKGIVKGTNGKALPDHSVTRAEFATFLVQTLGLTEESEINFKDADSSAWYFSNLAKAYHAGLIKGFGNDAIRPNDQITREQMAVMVYQGLKAKGIALNSEKAVTFKDQAQISPWSAEAVHAVAAMEMINGFPDETFMPQSKATRAQALVMLSKLLD